MPYTKSFREEIHEIFSTCMGCIVKSNALNNAILTSLNKVLIKEKPKNTQQVNEQIV